MMKDHLGWKMTLDGRGPWKEDDLGRTTTLNGRRPLIEDDPKEDKSLSPPIKKLSSPHPKKRFF